MLNKIKSLFGFGSATPVEAPYKVEVAAPVVEPMPIGIDAIVATPVVETVPAKREPAKRGPAKPKAPAVVKVPSAPKKPRVTKAK